MDGNVSFREVLTYMLNAGQTDVGIKGANGIFKISFEDMVSLFGGNRNG